MLESARNAFIEHGVPEPQLHHGQNRIIVIHEIPHIRRQALFFECAPHNAELSLVQHQKRLPCQVFQTDFRPFGKRVRFRQHSDHPVLEQKLSLLRRVRVHVRKAQVDAPVGEPLRDLVILPLPHGKAYAGIARGKRLNTRRKIGSADARKRPKAQLAGLELGELSFSALESSLRRRNFLQIRKVAFAVTRQLQAVRLAAQQRRSKLLLERFDRLAHGALRVIEALCCRCEASELHDRTEHPIF